MCAKGKNKERRFWIDPCSHGSAEKGGRKERGNQFHVLEAEEGRGKREKYPLNKTSCSKKEKTLLCFSAKRNCGEEEGAKEKRGGIRGGRGKRGNKSPIESKDRLQDGRGEEKKEESGYSDLSQTADREENKKKKETHCACQGKGRRRDIISDWHAEKKKEKRKGRLYFQELL